MINTVKSEYHVKLIKIISFISYWDNKKQDLDYKVNFSFSKVFYLEMGLKPIQKKRSSAQS